METKGLKQEHVHIIYCGDQDPSGVNIDYYLQKRLKQLGILQLDFRRIAVTSKQVTKFNLPLMAIEGGNPNIEEFKRVHGNKATHLNAFFTRKHLKDFKKILIAAVEEHWDQSIHDNGKGLRH